MPTVPLRRFRDLGAVVRAVRESRGLTQDDLAGSLGFSRDYLRQLERGESTVYTSRLFRLLDRLGVRLTVTYDLGADERH